MGSADTVSTAPASCRGTGGNVDTVTALVIVALALAACTLALLIVTAFRVHTLEWRVDRLEQEVLTGVSSFPPSEDLPEMLRRQAD